ncbi:unnamed protein product [Caretta caretta]
MSNRLEFHRFTNQKSPLFYLRRLLTNLVSLVSCDQWEGAVRGAQSGLGRAPWASRRANGSSSRADTAQQLVIWLIAGDSVRVRAGRGVERSRAEPPLPPPPPLSLRRLPRAGLGAGSWAGLAADPYLALSLKLFSV